MPQSTVPRLNLSSIQLPGLVPSIIVTVRWMFQLPRATRRRSHLASPVAAPHPQNRRPARAPRVSLQHLAMVRLERPPPERSHQAPPP
eukprot:7160362-Lingulodinium_polyedra.AAC.1